MTNGESCPIGRDGVSYGPRSILRAKAAPQLIGACSQFKVERWHSVMFYAIRWFLECPLGISRP